MGVFQLGGICNCCGGTTICVTVCTSPSTPVVGAVVELFTGLTLIDSCTTVSGGCCSFTQTGTYTIRVVYGGNTTSFGSHTLSGGTIGLNLTAAQANVICCGPCPIPLNMTLTDSNQTVAFDYNPTFDFWFGCYTLSFNNIINNTAFTGPGAGCCQIGTGTIVVAYTGQCVTVGASSQFQVDMYYPTNSYDPTSGPQPVCCNPFIPGSGWFTLCCGSLACASVICTYSYWNPGCNPGALPPNAYSPITLTQAWSNCSPFAWSGTLPLSPSGCIGFATVPCTWPVPTTLAVAINA